MMLQSPEITSLPDHKKIDLIAFHIEKILTIIGLDVTEESICQTPRRYAKMLIEDLFTGLKAENFPKITTQENKFKYNQMLIEANISINSICEHHFIPILGYCHIAYFPGEKIIGLSKLNRVAQYFAKRPQVQERMTKQIRERLSLVLETEDVAVVIDALHLCVRMRGVRDANALTRSLDLGGRFLHPATHQEFLSMIPRLQDVKL